MRKKQEAVCLEGIPEEKNHIEQTDKIRDC